MYIIANIVQVFLLICYSPSHYATPRIFASQNYDKFFSVVYFHMFASLGIMQ